MAAGAWTGGMPWGVSPWTGSAPGRAGMVRRVVHGRGRQAVEARARLEARRGAPAEDGRGPAAQRGGGEVELEVGAC